MGSQAPAHSDSKASCEAAVQRSKERGHVPGKLSKTAPLAAACSASSRQPDSFCWAKKGERVRVAPAAADGTPLVQRLTPVDDDVPGECTGAIQVRPLRAQVLDGILEPAILSLVPQVYLRHDQAHICMIRHTSA